MQDIQLIQDRFKKYLFRSKGKFRLVFVDSSVAHEVSSMLKARSNKFNLFLFYRGHIN
jgi:hypothetical protein